MLRVVLFALLVLGLTAQPVAASVAGSDGTTILVVGGDEASDISFPTTSFSDLAIEDLAGITATDGCTQREPTVVTCPGSRIEAALGGGDDRWSDSSATPALVDAGPGNDTVLAGQFDDILIGGDGNDHLDGDSENDSLQGGPGDDTLFGDDADDQLDGGPGEDRLNGDGPTGVLSGNDTLNAADGEQDLVDCNFGADSAVVDAIDTTANCESVDVKGGGGDPDPPDPGSARLTVSVPRSVARAKFAGKGVAGRLETSRSGTMTITLALTAEQARRAGVARKPVTLATLKAPVAGGPATFRVVPARRYRAALREASPFKATVSFVLRTGASAPAQARRTVTVR